MINLTRNILGRMCAFSRYSFSKNSDNSKHQSPKNQNYLKSKVPIKKEQAKPKSEPQQIQPLLAFDNQKDFKFVILSNVGLMGLIPFAPTVALGMCILNGGIIMSRLGQQFKKYLLLVNNNESDPLGTFRHVSQYQKVIVTHAGCLSLQSILLTLYPVEVALLFNIGWIAISIGQKIVPSSFYLVFIPIVLSIVLSYFSQAVRAFLLSSP